jgi:ATP-dependent DNA helicase RecG
MREVSPGVYSDSGNIMDNVGIKNDILNIMREDATVSDLKISELLGKSERTIERHISELKMQGVVQRIGSKKTGNWVVLSDE